MKTKNLLFAALCFILLAGCETAPPTADITVRLGMTRDDLRSFYGEPLRIERAASGGEDWYYRFFSWDAQPTGSTERSVEFGQQTSTVSAGVEFSKKTEERPVHISPDGYVVRPLPDGKVVKN